MRKSTAKSDECIECPRCRAQLTENEAQSIADQVQARSDARRSAENAAMLDALSPVQFPDTAPLELPDGEPFDLSEIENPLPPCGVLGCHHPEHQAKREP